MSDTSINTARTPGVRGQTRSTWRDENHLRGLLMRLYRQNPNADRDELEELYLIAAKEREALVDEALRRSFDNDYARVHQPARPQRRAAAADVSSLVSNIRSVILLDLVQPNGKPLRECTGRECRGFSGWHARIADRIGDDGIVGEVLTEADVVDIRDSSTEGAAR